MRILRKKLFAMSLFFLIISLTGCLHQESNDIQEIKKTIITYNFSLSKAFKEFSLNKVKEMADAKVIKRLDKYISAYLLAGQFMETKLLRLDFKKMEVETNRATVITIETWLYRWSDYKTGKPLENFQRINYEIIYYVEKRKDRWIIKDCTVLVFT